MFLIYVRLLQVLYLRIPDDSALVFSFEEISTFEDLLENTMVDYGGDTPDNDDDDDEK